MKFTGLLEIIQSEPVILTAIHKLKANKGSETAGVDGQTMRIDILHNEFEDVLNMVKEKLSHYKPKLIRRKHIPKGNTGKMRPLGIPVIVDRIIQECVRSVIEPICEAHFWRHSYGFRPWRSTEHAIARVGDVLHKSGKHWVVEGDISKFFDNVNHRILIKQLWSFGIKDKRVLMIIKEMLKAGIMGETTVNELGTPQGGIISPLLANVYLTPFDHFITREWENKKLRVRNKPLSEIQRWLVITGKSGKPRLKQKCSYLIRYADDWVIITDSKENAEKLVSKAHKYLKDRLKLELSLEKTKITNVRTSPIKFVGYSLRMVRGNAEKGYITRSRPIKDRLDLKIKELLKEISMLTKCKDMETCIMDMNNINSKIRGLVNYYQCTTWASQDFKMYNQRIRWKAYNVLNRRFRSKSGKSKVVDWIPAKECTNLPNLHVNYTTALPTLIYKEHKIGITDLAFITFNRPTLFNQKETPFTLEGRELHKKRTEKAEKGVRLDHIFGTGSVLTKAMLANRNYQNNKYNFEFFLNRAYAYNRDRGKCRLCKDDVFLEELNTHHERPYLPLDKINRVNHLATVHSRCHKLIHSKTDEMTLLKIGISKPVVKKILSFRNKLVLS